MVTGENGEELRGRADVVGGGRTHLSEEERLATGLQLGAGGSVASKREGLGQSEGGEESSGGEDELSLASSSSEGSPSWLFGDCRFDW